MSRIISAQISGNLEEDYEEIESNVLEDDEISVSKSEILRNVIRDGIDYEQNPYELLDLPREVAAHVEDDREDNESESAPIKRAVVDGIESRRGDTVDGIGGDEDLRDMVDRVREDGEELDETIRRLVRDGVDKNTERPLGERVETGFAVVALLLSPVLVALWSSILASIVFSLILGVGVVFEPRINRVLSRAREILLSRVVDRIPSAPRVLGRN
jgi:hypothetical protein